MFNPYSDNCIAKERLIIIMSQKALWAGASVIVFGGFAAKQLIWNKVSEEVAINRQKEHEEASRHLAQAYETSKKYYVAPFTEEEIKKIHALKLYEDFDDLSKCNPTSSSGKANSLVSTRQV